MKRLSEFRSAALFSVLLCCWQPAMAQEATDLQAERKVRLEFMAQKLDEFRLFREDKPDEHFPRTKSPVLRYSNPVRNFFSDGATFLWLDGKRPLAVGSISVRGNGQVFREFTSLSEKPLSCVYKNKVVWSPRASGLPRQTFDDAPEPSTSPRLRLTQMRRLAGRFTVTFKSPKMRDFGDSRLLTQPLYRYAADADGLIDGAIFAFAESNDPESLLILEVIRKSSNAKPTWRYSLARMSSVPQVFRLDGREIWSVKGFWKNPRSRNDPYVEAWVGKYQSPPKDEKPIRAEE